MWRHLKNGESKGMSQVLRGLEHLLPVVSIQVDAAEHVQLRVHPVQPAFDQICTEERKNRERNKRESRDKQTQ